VLDRYTDGDILWQKNYIYIQAREGMMTGKTAQRITVNLLSLAGVIVGLLTWLITGSGGWGLIGGIIAAVISIPVGFVLNRVWNVRIPLFQWFFDLLFGGEDKSARLDKSGPRGAGSYRKEP